MKQTRKLQYDSYPGFKQKPFPVLRLAGKYLETLGFNIADIVKVTYEPNKIIIEK